MEAREAGQLYEFLNEKLSAYKEGGQAAANTFAASEQRLKNETEQLYGEISKPVFEALKESLNALNDGLKDGSVQEELKGVGYDVAEIVKDGAAMLKWAVELSPVLVRVAEGVGAISLAIALLKLPGLIASLGEKSLKWLLNADAIDKETAALKRNTVQTEENNLVKETSPVPVVGKGVGAAGAGAAGASTLGTTIGVSLVALEAGLILIQKWEAAQNEAIDTSQKISDSGSQDILALREQIDLAETAKQKDEARAKAKQVLADIDAKIAANQSSAYTTEGQKYTLYNDPDLDTILKQQRLGAQRTLDTFDDNAGSDAEGARQRAADAKAKKDKAALDAYQQTPDYKLGEAESSGDQDKIDDAEYDDKVAKLKTNLIEKHRLGEDDAELEAQRLVTGREQTKEAQSLRTELEHITGELEKQRDAATINRDLTAKQAELLAALPSGIGGDVSSLAGAVTSLPQGTEAEIAQKSRLADLLKEILALKKEGEAADNREKADAESAKKLGDAIAAEKEETAILRARAKGENEVADALEKQRDLRRESHALQVLGASQAEADAIALDKINAQNDEQDRKDADRASRHVARASGGADDRERRGGHGFVIHGYSGGDTGGGLTTGGLTTGGLSAGGGLDSSAAAALAAAPSYVPSFPSARTATDGLAPALAAAPQLSLGTGASGANDPLSAAASKFGNSAQGGLDKAAQSLDKLSETLVGGFTGLVGRIEQIEGNVRQVQAQVANHA